MADLTLRCQQRVDMENDGAISPAEWANLISEAYAEIYTITTDCPWGIEYFEVTHQYTTGGTNVLTEQADHYSTVALAYLEDAALGRYRNLRALTPQERISRSGLNLTAGSRATEYAMAGQSIYLYPTPPSGQIYELRYVPQSPDFTTISTGIDVVTPEGLSFLIWNVAVMAQAKIEADPQLAMARLEQSRERFITSVMARNATAPLRRIVDVELDGYSTEWDRWP